MQQDWVIDVLADLRVFARQNGLPALAEQLDDTILLAASEIERKRQGSGVAGGNEGKAGTSDHRFAASRHPR